MPAVATTDIERALAAYLVGLPGVNAIVEARVSPIKSTQDDTRRRIVYQLVSDVDVPVMKGATGLKRALFHVACWGPTTEASQTLAHEVAGTRANKRLNFFSSAVSGLMGGLAWVQFCRVTDRTAELEEAWAGEDGGEHRRLLEVAITYKEP
jgi:hypothetical protein